MAANKPKLVRLFFAGFSSEAIEITKSGTYDVSQYATANVNVTSVNSLTWNEFKTMMANNEYEEGKTYQIEYESDN